MADNVLRLSSIASISCLFLAAGPSAIPWFVVSINVNAINRFLAFWCSPHVGKKLFKCSPLFADDYASPTIPFVARIVWIPAPSKHTQPRGIFRGLATSFGIRMFGDSIDVEAPARPMFSKRQVACSYIYDFSAITEAYPADFNPKVCASLKNFKAMEFLASQVNKFSHQGFHMLMADNGVKYAR